MINVQLTFSVQNWTAKGGNCCEKKIIYCVPSVALEPDFSGLF